jgi:hypothetical protein
MCFVKYYNDVSARPHWTVMHDLDSAVELVGCVWHSIRGSGPLYHCVEKREAFTQSEKKQATALATRVRRHAKSKHGRRARGEHSKLADNAYRFAIACLVRRGATHKGAPKLPTK